MSFDNLAQFLLYVTPGFLVLALYHRKYPVRKESDFTTAAWSLIYGVILLVIVTWLDDHLPHCNFHSNSLVNNGGKSQSCPDLIFVFWLFVAALIFTAIKIRYRELRFWFSNRFSCLEWIAPHPEATWQRVCQPSNKDWKIVYLEDGSIYIGQIKYWTFVPDREDQDFVLGQAIRVDENLDSLYAVNGMGVYINTKQVKKIELLETADVSDSSEI